MVIDSGTLARVACRWAAPVNANATLTPGSPRARFSSAGLVILPSREVNYDVTPDGKRFVLIEPVEDEGEVPKPSIRIIRNWHEEFRDLE
jgi:hypothetical protein